MAGFANGSYAKVWDVKEVDGKNALDVQLSISSKNKSTGEYKTDFSGFVRFYGDAYSTAKDKLSKDDRIKLLSVSVNSNYNKETKVTKYYFSVFDWEPAEGRPENAEKKENDYPFVGKEDKKEAPAANEPW